MASEEAVPSRSSGGSARSTHSRRPQNPQQQLSQIEKSVTHLLVATKQLLETLTLWSRGTATEGEVSDVYVRLGYEFNIASRAFNAIGVDTQDLGNVPELLRGILEETLSQEASQASLDRYLPRIRDIIINLLKGLKKKQQRLRQRKERDGSVSGSPGQNGTNGRQTSVGSVSVAELDDGQMPFATSRPPSHRQGSTDAASTSLPPRTSSVGGRASPSKNDSFPNNSKTGRTTSSRDTVGSDSSLSSNTMQNMPVISPYPQEETMPGGPDGKDPPYVDFPPPPPPPKQQDAFAALQRGGELERRASRRFSAYQIQKLVGGNGISLPPAQNSPVPNRGKDMRDSMNAVRTRASQMQMHNRQKSTTRRVLGTSPPRTNETISREASEDVLQEQKPTTPPDSMSAEPLAERASDAPDAQATSDPRRPPLRATLSAPLDGPAELPVESDAPTTTNQVETYDARQVKTPSPQPEQFIPEQSPQPGKELTLFLQYKSKIKKFVLGDGYNDLTSARLQLAFIEKFAWNTHSNGELPDIYIQDPVSGVRHELEDLNDIKDRCVLVLNIESLDEVKRHIDDGIGGLRRIVEDIKSSIDDQQGSIQRLSDRQTDTAKEIASLAAAPPSTRAPSMLSPTSKSSGPITKDSKAQLNEVSSLRRDLAIVRQTYTSFVADVESSMSAIRTKAAAVKATAIDAAIPKLKGDTGRAYINDGKKTLGDDSEKIVTRVDDLQDMIEDLRKDVVLRGVRPLPRQLETVAKDLSLATSELRKLRELLKKEKPIWTKVWEQELQTVCEERDYLTMQEELANDLEDDLEKAGSTFVLVEQATKQQHLTSQNGGVRSASGKSLNALAIDRAVDPRAAKDGVLGEVKALQPNHESRLEAIERAEKARQRELESRRDGEFQKELGKFVDEGKLKKSGGVEEAERLRKAKDERIRREVWDKKPSKSRPPLDDAAAVEAPPPLAVHEPATNGTTNHDGANGTTELVAPS